MLDKTCYNNINIVVKPKEISYITKSGCSTKSLDLNTEKIRQQLNEIGFICPYNRDTKYEYYSIELEKYGLPYMNFIYYYELFKLQRIPTFEEFYRAYLRIYCDKVDETHYTVKPFFDKVDFVFTEHQLMGRVFRSYNSFHREIDLLYQLSKYNGLDIKYSFQDDLQGVDFTVNFRGKTFCLASYIATQKSYDWKAKKNSQRHDYSGKEMIDIVAEWNPKNGDINCDNINGIYLYSKSFVASKYFEMVKKTENKN